MLGIDMVCAVEAEPAYAEMGGIGKGAALPAGPFEKLFEIVTVVVDAVYRLFEVHLAGGGGVVFAPPVVEAESDV